MTVVVDDVPDTPDGGPPAAPPGTAAASAAGKASAHARTSLNRDFKPKPTGAATPVTRKPTTKSKREYTSRPGPAHNYCAWRCYLFTIVALQSGLGMTAVAGLYHIPAKKATAIFSTFVMFIYRTLLREQPPISSARSRKRMPAHWNKMMKTNDIKLIVDATEFRVEGTSVLARARGHYSQYKKGYTIKLLVGITAHGTIVFVSYAYPGKITDYEITKVCGVMDLLEEGDLLLADRGFNIADILSEKMSALLVGHTHAVGEKERMEGKYTYDQLLQMQRYSNLRIHVERAMASIKRMACLQRVIRHDQKHLIAPIIGIAAMLSNYGRPLLNREDTERVWVLDA